MLILRIFILFLASLVGQYNGFSFSRDANNFGPYVLSITKYESCPGPKTNVATMIAELFTNETTAAVIYNTTFLVPVRLSEIKVHVSHVNGAQRTTLWNYKVDKPCQHFAIASIIAKYVPMQQNCIFKKSELYFVIDFKAVAHQFFGEQFFYGEFMFKITVLSAQGNIMCAVMNLMFDKKQV